MRECERKLPAYLAAKKAASSKGDDATDDYMSDDSLTNRADEYRAGASGGVGEHELHSSCGAGAKKTPQEPMGKPVSTGDSIVVLYGSKTEFEKFDSSHIGEGKGDEKHGHGLYFSESPDVAERYQIELPGQLAATFTSQKSMRSRINLLTWISPFLVNRNAFKPR